MTIDNGKTVLIYFLQNLAQSISQNTINAKQLQLVGEFYMNYMHSTMHVKDEGVVSDKEMMKFLILGWFVYKILLAE